MPSPSRPDWSGRLHRLAASLERYRVGAFVVSAPSNIRYLSGFTGSAGVLVFAAGGFRLIVDGRYHAAARDAMAAGAMARGTLVRAAGRYDASLENVLGALAAARVGFEAGHVTVAAQGAWQRQMTGVEWVPTQGVVESLRLIKDAGEIDRLRRAARRLSDVARNLGEWVRAGATEREVARSIDAAMDSAGFSMPAFPTIVASGPNSAHPHARPGDRPLVRGDLVVLDFGGVLDGYCVDLTRMAAVGRPVARLQALFDAVRAAQASAIAAVAPGVAASAVDGAARRELDERGLGEAFVHATGHGLGLDVHEAPRLGTDAHGDVLSPGMVFTVEPGVYVDGLGGARLEDDVLVTPGGREVLTDAPGDLLVV
jgi:Xaa-Pro aminopeptidase